MWPMLEDTGQPRLGQQQPAPSRGFACAHMPTHMIIDPCHVHVQVLHSIFDGLDVISTLLPALFASAAARQPHATQVQGLPEQA